MSIYKEASLIEKGNYDLFGRVPIRSISFSQEQIILDIIQLHCGSDIELDPTYSIGNFYKGKIKRPKLKYDINPQIDGVEQASADKLPLEDGSINTMMFDPPFVSGSHNEGFKTGIIKERFSYYKTTYELWKFYYMALIEFYRILKMNGVLIFKCQDVIDGGKNFFSHCEVMNMAINIGFYPKDLFILLVNDRIIDVDREDQQHARKFHSYFWVFKKTKPKVKYSTNE